MFVVTNKAEVKKQVSINRVMFWVGVVCLVASMGVLLLGAGNTITIFTLGYPFLIGGVILSKRGAFNNRRHGVGGYKIKPEEAEIDEELKGVPNRYHLFNYLDIGNAIYEHVLVTPNGFILLEVKPQIGTLKAGRDLFRLKRGFTNFIGTIGEPGFGNPSKDLSRRVKALRKFFEEKGYDIPTDGIIVLNNPRTTIQAVEDMSFPVCKLGDLRLAIREWDTELNMNAEEQLEIERIIVDKLAEPQKTEVLELLSMPQAKRAALQAAADRAFAEQKAAQEAAKQKNKPAASKSPVSSTARDKIAAAKDRSKTAPATNNATNPLQQRLGMNGKPIPEKTVVEIKPKRRPVAPLQKPNPGAFGEVDRRKSK